MQNSNEQILTFKHKCPIVCKEGHPSLSLCFCQPQQQLSSLLSIYPLLLFSCHHHIVIRSLISYMFFNISRSTAMPAFILFFFCQFFRALCHLFISGEQILPPADRVLPRHKWVKITLLTFPGSLRRFLNQQIDDGRVLQGPGWGSGPRLLALPFSRTWHAWEVPTYRVLCSQCAGRVCTYISRIMFYCNSIDLFS